MATHTHTTDHHHTRHARGVRARFSVAAAGYDAVAFVQKTVASKLLELLPEPVTASRVLDIGCGTGQLTERVLPLLPDTARLDAIDVSPAMIAEGAKRLGPAADVHWRVADVRDFAPADVRYDLIVSSSALHWVVPFADSVKALARLLNPGGTVLCAIMIDGTLGELHRTRASVAPAVSPPAVLPTKKTVLTAFTKAGFTVEQHLTKSIVATYDSAGTFLRTIHDQGLTGGSVSQGRRLLTAGELRRLTTLYEEQFRVHQNGVRATYKSIFLRAVHR